MINDMEDEYRFADTAGLIIRLENFKRRASKELGINWGQMVILAHLASPDVTFLSSPEIVEATGMDRVWTYRNVRKLLLKGLVDSVKQLGSRNQVQALYSLNGKGRFYLTQTLMKNGIDLIKAFEKFP